VVRVDAAQVVDVQRDAGVVDEALEELAKRSTGSKLPMHGAR
jgi:hypothetical protein